MYNAHGVIDVAFESSALRAMYRVRTEACVIRKIRTPASRIDMAVSGTRIVRIPSRYTRAGYIAVIGAGRGYGI